MTTDTSPCGRIYGAPSAGTLKIILTFFSSLGDSKTLFHTIHYRITGFPLTEFFSTWIFRVYGALPIIALCIKRTRQASFPVLSAIPGAIISDGDKGLPQQILLVHLLKNHRSI
jgi:hypothetical protein